MIGVDNLFLKMYATLSITGVVVAIIMCRVPPLSKQSNAYYAPVGCQVSEDIPEGCTKLQWAFLLTFGLVFLNINDFKNKKNAKKIRL